MKTKTLALIAVLLVAGAPLAAQRPAGPAPQPEQGTPEKNRRPGATTTAPQPRGEMNAPQPGGWAGPQHQPRQPDPFGENFFPPELIMHNQRALNLTDEQRKRIVEIIQKAQPQLTEHQWQLEAEQATMQALLRVGQSDEKQIIGQLDKVLRLEGEMRRGQVTLLVRLKNELTTEQQARLRELSRHPRPPR